MTDGETRNARIFCSISLGVLFVGLVVREGTIVVDIIVGYFALHLLFCTPREEVKGE